MQLLVPAVVLALMAGGCVDTGDKEVGENLSRQFKERHGHEDWYRHIKKIKAGVHEEDVRIETDLDGSVAGASEKARVICEAMNNMTPTKGDFTRVHGKRTTLHRELKPDGSVAEDRDVEDAYLAQSKMHIRDDGPD